MKKTFHPFHIGEWWYCFAVIEGKLACFRSKKLTLAEGDSASGEGGEMKEAVSELFSLIAQLFVEKGLNVGDMPKLGIGVYSIQVNRTDHEINSVPGYHAYITYNGWPFALLSPYDGICGDGAVANEYALIELLRKELGQKFPAVKGG